LDRVLTKQSGAARPAQGSAAIFAAYAAQVIAGLSWQIAIVFGPAMAERGRKGAAPVLTLILATICLFHAIRPPVPRPFGRGSRSEATQAGHWYSAGVVDVNVRS
jgi:hypothetical protein